MANDQDEQHVRDLALKAERGMTGQGAIVEMLSVFKQAVDRHVAASNRLNRTMLLLTGVGVALIVVQIFLAIMGKG